MKANHSISTNICWMTTQGHHYWLWWFSLSKIYLVWSTVSDKKAQLSLTNPRDEKPCQKLLQFDVLTTLSLTILAYLHSFSCCCVRNLRNPAKFTENSSLWSSRSSKVIDFGVNRKPMYDFLLVTNSNFGRICYRFRDMTLKAGKSLNFHTLPFFEAP